ncbi:hypothetical protein ABBQ38_002650 [Trebouxia sp. C0009 RCD-2024]
MAEAFRQQGISLSVFSTYPPGLSNTPWPSTLLKLFASANQGHTHGTTKEEEQQQQQQQQQQQGSKLLREECSVGMMPGHFVLLSRQWGAVVKQLQRQRNKRKADQAFPGVPLAGLHGKHAAALAAPQPLPAPKIEPGVGQQAPPTQTSAAPRVGVAAPVEMKTNGGNHLNLVQSRTALVDLTSPTEELVSAAPMTVDLTEEESPQIPPALPQKLLAPCVNGITARPEPQLGSNAAAHCQPSQPRPSAQAQQQRPPPVLASYPCQGLTPQQQHAALHQLQARQLSPCPLHASPANLNPNQQQLLLQKQQQAQQAQRQQQQQQPTSASPSPQAGGPNGPHQPQAQQALGYQQTRASLPPPQQQQQQQQQQLWHGAQAPAAQGQVRQQAETVGQPNRPKSASPPQGLPPNAQAQQQLQNLQQQLRLQRQLPHQQAHGQGGHPHAGWAQPSQAHSLQQIQAMQAQLTGQMQGQGSGQDQGQVAAALPQHGFSQPPGQAQHAYGMPQLSLSQGQVRQGQAPAALPLTRPGQIPAFSPAKGQPPARPGPAMVSPTASSSGSAAPPPAQSGGTPVVVWEGSIEATGQVMKKAESQHLMHCRLLAKPTTWPPHLEQGWGKVLTVTKNIFTTDLTKLLGPDAFTHAPRLLMQLIDCSEKGKSFIQDLSVQKAMGVIQVPTAGKFLGILVTTPPTAPQHKILALVLNLPHQQGQRPAQAQR